jgi:hypothetical protein
MTHKTLLAAGAALALLTAPALAQTGEAAAPTPTPAPATEPAPGSEADVGAVLGAGALPGVGIGTTTMTEENAPVGPGGLQNGVGAAGTMAPDTTGAAGDVGGGVPGTDATSPGMGIPIETTPGVPGTAPAN